MKKITLATLFFVTPVFLANSAADKGRRDEKDENLYSSFGKRDPFQVPERGGVGGKQTALDPIRKFRLEGYRLRAVLRTGGKTQAMFEDPEGVSHIVLEGQQIGMEGARVSRIVDSEVIVTERSVNYLGKETLLEKVISLPTAVEGKPDLAVPTPAVLVKQVSPATPASESVEKQSSNEK